MILAAITIPAHALALRAPWPSAPPQPPAVDRTPIPRSRPFLLLAAAFTLSSFAMYAVVMGLIPLLTERGATPTQAAWALGLGGAGQTLGRTLYAGLSTRTSVTTRTVTLITLGGATTAALAVVPGPIPLLVLLAVLAGVVRGNLTLLQATAVTDRWGTTHYGRLSALLGAPAHITAALAPWACAALMRPPRRLPTPLRGTGRHLAHRGSTGGRTRKEGFPGGELRVAGRRMTPALFPL